MLITAIELEDIKSHAAAKFEFRKGTTAIIGENGAGKTTLIEAIAWTMFDLLDYTKDAFVRKGAKRGVARVSFESVLDERTYVVHRDTGTGYYVYDPSIKTRVADKKDEVQRFLRQHMGVEAGTDLEALFRSAIGVPQGTFTSIFLETPTARKRSFDKLLKVEEYRQSSERLIETVNYIKGLLIETENRISFARGKLEGYDELKKRAKALGSEEKELADRLKKSGKAAEKLRKEVDKYKEIESEIAVLKEKIDSVSGDLSEKKIAAAAKESEVKTSKEASAKLKDVEKEHAEHLKALGMIKELERERGERDRLNKEISEIDSALSKVKVEREKNASELEKIASARKQIEELKPKVEEQAGLEQKREKIRNRIADARAATNSLSKLDKEVVALRARYKEVAAEMKTAESAKALAADLPSLVEEDDKLRARLADLRGKLENDRKFQSEIRNGLCPVLSQKCLNLKEGETLDGFLRNQFTELADEIETAEKRRKEVTTDLSKARKAESEAARYEPLSKRAEEIAAEGKRLNEEKDALERSAGEAKELAKDLDEVEARLKKLDNPSATVKILSEQTGNEIGIREMLTKAESNLERLESDKRLKTEQLESYKDLDFNWKKFTELRDETLEGHRTHIANEPQAALLEEREKALASLTKEAGDLEKELGKLRKESEKKASGFDREAFAKQKAELSELETSIAVATSKLEDTARRREDSEKELAALEEIREELKAGEAEKKRLEKLSRTTAFVRNTLKEAAPRVAQSYIYHVSIEANRMFRDITGNAEHTLKWENDYGIALEEGGYDRPFQNLSGGEQMAAALSVRLALLRQLSDIKLAFFDEPTTNLDLERRERLAEQISRITESRAFDQLFVISHDDTFEAYVDNVIVIEPGEFEQGSEQYPER
ncbi:MAG: AAA family ATPase [Acidobacteriota bacterium]|nr:MAG: AAA family ATPase [Acidobacteriota bacterium]